MFFLNRVCFFCFPRLFFSFRPGATFIFFKYFCNLISRKFHLSEIFRFGVKGTLPMADEIRISAHFRTGCKTQCRQDVPYSSIGCSIHPAGVQNNIFFYYFLRLKFINKLYRCNGGSEKYETGCRPLV